MVHIKKVVIQGFKSYKELLDLEPFSKGSNVIGTPPATTRPFKNELIIDATLSLRQLGATARASPISSLVRITERLFVF